MIRTRLIAGLSLVLTSVTVPSQAAAETAGDATDQSQTAAEQSDQSKSGSSPQKSRQQVVIEADRPWNYNKDTRYAHSLPEVDGPTITVTKKTSMVELDAQPTIIDNNQREIFDRLPGVVLAEQQNPTQLNLSYRGLGNPQESEYVLVMQDGIPLELDWIGYPTLYNLPVPQTLASVQMIRGGSGLLYGPEPQPVINFISRPPDPQHPASGTTEQVGGEYGLFSSFNRVSGTSGDWNYLADFSHRESDGQRGNGDYTLNAGDVHLGYHFDAHESLAFDLHAYSLDSGLAGLMSYAQFQADARQTTTPADHLWTDRYTGVLTYQNDFSRDSSFIQRLWTGYTDLLTRSDTYAGTDPAGVTAVSAQLSGQRFHYTGLDGRWLARWGTGNALTVGYTAYASTSPYDEYLSTNPYLARDDESGTPFYRSERGSRYGALFAENVFRLPHRFHVVLSGRYEEEQLTTHEYVAPHPLLVDDTYRKGIPLFGIGIGNDFGVGNETYLNVSQGFRPLRYLDIASPFSNFSPTNNPDPTHYLTYEGGAHGWPLPGFYYDASLFQVNVRNRIESEAISQTETIDVNTGDTRSRGFEAETSYDLLRLTDFASSEHLDVFANLSLLDATFTASITPGQTGKTPAYAPHYVFKTGVTLRRDQIYKLSLVLDSVGAQYFQDSDTPVAGTPAQIPSYTVIDLAADYTIAQHLRLLAGVSNLFDRNYYSRVFLFGGSIEPAERRAFYAGAAYDF
ncbi:MAG TPA: TonB-dependent receptor [Steroidobacteraceae bacterium]|jgi:Fe(3+) dicitrate transport protein|nr:TonB-dependent receptor [Steroidobacteraceae bacterium]